MTKKHYEIISASKISRDNLQAEIYAGLQHNDMDENDPTVYITEFEASKIPRKGKSLFAKKSHKAAFIAEASNPEEFKLVDSYLQTHYTALCGREVSDHFDLPCGDESNSRSHFTRMMGIVAGTCAIAIGGPVAINLSQNSSVQSYESAIKSGATSATVFFEREWDTNGNNRGAGVYSNHLDISLKNISSELKFDTTWYSGGPFKGVVNGSITGPVNIVKLAVESLDEVDDMEIGKPSFFYDTEVGK